MGDLILVKENFSLREFVRSCRAPTLPDLVFHWRRIFLFKKFRSVKIKFHLVGKWLFVGLLRMIEACKQATLLFHVQFATPRDINKIDNKEVLEQQDTMS